MKIYNSLSRKVEEFKPIKPPNVGMYTCGPTVYDYAHIGNFRSYLLGDLLLRTLEHNGFKVDYIMNLTDVGHLTGDNLGDADIGEDRMEKGARREGKSVWDVAEFYTKAFLKDFKALNLVKPELFSKATDHIQEQIDLVKKLEKRGFSYKTSDGVYFDTAQFEEKTGKKYGELSTLDEIKEGARVKKNPEKKNSRDFALWKFSPKNKKREMEWDSPWGIGFPGWHIECSAMGMKYLGETFDIHVGGEDLRSTHHPNEIAQSEAVTGKRFVKYWLHNAFILVNGKRMSKSGGNYYKLQDLVKKGFDPLALRYLYLTAHYRDKLNFTLGSLGGAQKTLNNLREKIASFKRNTRSGLSVEKQKKVEDYRNRFTDAINNDLNTPQALAVLWEVMKSNIPSTDKFDLALSFDEVLGLDLAKISKSKTQIPKEVKELLEKREKLRKAGKFGESDRVREKIESLGHKVQDPPIPAKNEKDSK